MANPATIKAFKDLVLKTDKIMKAQKKINPRFDLEISSSLSLAIKAKDGPKIELYLTTLKATLIIPNWAAPRYLATRIPTSKPERMRENFSTRIQMLFLT